jgi:ADP-heptose:LPS heptosyltransferase
MCPEFDAVPAHDLECIDISGVWRSTGNDPQFLLKPKGQESAIRGGWLRVEISLQFHDNARRPRLYWDAGEGFSEQQCHLLPLPRNGKVSAVLPLPHKLNALRLDPLDCDGMFTLSAVRIKPVSRVIAVAALVLPYAAKALRNPRVYAGVARDFFVLWRVRGAVGVKAALRHLALTGCGTSVRNFVYGQLHGTVRRRVAGAATLTFGLSRRERFLARRRGTQKHQIGIGLVEHFGDIVACEPVARHVKKLYPEAEISWVVREPYRELIDSNPFVDRTIAVDCLTDWIKLQQHGLFDEVVDLHVNERICQHCNIPLLKRVGNPSITGNNYFEYGSLLESFCLGAGLPPLTDAPRVYISASVVQAVDTLALPDRFVVIHCSSNEAYKDWSPQKWNELITWCVHEYQVAVVEVGLRPVLAGNRTGVIDLCGKTSLLETAEVIRRARLFIGVDSGPAHLANAVGTYGVVLLGRIGPFKMYNPFTGGFGDGSNAILLRNEHGPAIDIPVGRVQEAIAARLANESAWSSTVQSEGDLVNQVGRALLVTPAFEAGQSDVKGVWQLPRVIAFYLPQYHPIPENDANWGKGFTEWRNVGKARPFFDGQYQPRLPGELGYYDLRLPEIMDQQAALAAEYGIFGFCYYFYWFQGKRLLHLPIDNMLRRRKPDFPFCFCWANENWTRRWDGMEKEIIVAQKHTHEDDVNLIRHLIPAFEDPRYIRVNGKPLLLVYRTELFPNPLETAETWRTEALKAGIGDLYLVRCEGFDPFTNPEDIGFNASYEVPTFILPDELLYDDVQNLNVAPDFKGRIFDYEKIVRFYSERPEAPYRRYKDVMLAWDNTPRHGNNAVIFHGVTPEKYGEWLRNCLQHSMKKFRGEERLVFINAWNEWAEGSYLEPDLRYGRGFLEATKVAIDAVSQLEQQPQKLFGPSRHVLRSIT